MCGCSKNGSCVIGYFLKMFSKEEKKKIHRMVTVAVVRSRERDMYKEGESS